MSDSVQPHRWQPTRLPCPWDSPGKNTGVGCHFPLQCIKVESESEVAQSCPTPSDPMDCSPPGSSIHGIFQARVLEWGAIAFSNNGILLSHKKERNNDICSHMNATRDYHTRWNKTEREKTNPLYHLHVESKIWNKWTYLWNRNGISDTENKLVVAKRKRSERSLNWEFGISRWKLVYTE